MVSARLLFLFLEIFPFHHCLTYHQRKRAVARLAHHHVFFSLLLSLFSLHTIAFACFFAQTLSSGQFKNSINLPRYALQGHVAPQPI
jgi:hypothetical protein